MRNQSIKSILLIEDNPADARLFREILSVRESDPIALTHVECMRDAETYLAERTVDLILLDLGLPDAQGLAAVRRVRAAAPSVALVVLTGLNDESQAAQVLQEGAQDHLIKGQIDPRGLLRALNYARERKTMEEALFAEKERAQVTLDCIGDAVVCTDNLGNVTFLNLVAERMTGWSQQEAVGKPVDAVNHKPIPDQMARATGQNRIVHLPSNCLLVRRDGFESPIEDSIAPIHDRAGKATGAVIVFHDVTVERTMALQMAHAAQHDFLTGLPNRLLLTDHVNQAVNLAQRHGKRVAMLFLDLDGFKHINDSLGHPMGDKLLQSVAKRLEDSVRRSDTVSRQGGDEFIVLLSEVEHSEDAAIAARIILRTVAEVHPIENRDLHITASIGISVYPEDGLDTETLIRNADTAMYQAKQNGRHGYQFFTPAMNVRAVERQFVEESLRRGLERHEFALHYQPTVNLKSGTITGAEALIRWTHPIRGPVSPIDLRVSKYWVTMTSCMTSLEEAPSTTF